MSAHPKPPALGVDENESSVANAGGPPYDGNMEKRVEKPESDYAAIKVDLEILKATSATKADVAEAKVSIIIWVTSAIFLAQLLPAILKLFVQS